MRLALIERHSLIPVPNSFRQATGNMWLLGDPCYWLEIRTNNKNDGLGVRESTERLPLRAEVDLLNR